MNKKVLIVEDQFVEAHDLQLMLEKAGYAVCGIARSVVAAQDMIKKDRPGLVLLDIQLKGKLTGIDLARQLREENIAFIYLSANTSEEILAAAKTTEPYGFILKPFREKELLVTLEIAQYRHEFSRETRLRRESDMIRQLVQIEKEIFGWKEKLLKVGIILQQEIPFDYLAFQFNSPAVIEDRFMSFLRIGFNEYQSISTKELATMTGISLDHLNPILSVPKGENTAAFLHQEDLELATRSSLLKKLAMDTFRMKSLLYLPVMQEQHETCLINFFSRRPDIYSADHLALLDRIQAPLSNTFGYKPVRMPEENTSATIKKERSGIPEAPPKASPGFEGIIGTSHLLLNVFDQITQVAPFDTAILILGESGTGKERIADCIHNLSPRKSKPFIKVNCAALPATLIESELFGHEKGSFTGAIDKRIGKFEQANGGTIFLDEIGDMPLDLQVKLLRVLQEKEIEPVGSRSTVKINVRVIAATNKHLEKEVADGRFRLDLYYRLNVFPIELPPLRDRTEDIPALSQHFISIYNRKSGKKITGISEKGRMHLMAYAWPGNIRELENAIERSVLLAKGTIIEDLSLPGLHKNDHSVTTIPPPMKTMYENERDYIIAVLKKCHGRIWGTGGAAEVLNIPPTTLKSKMKKLGIEKPNFY